MSEPREPSESDAQWADPNRESSRRESPTGSDPTPAYPAEQPGYDPNSAQAWAPQPNPQQPYPQPAPGRQQWAPQQQWSGQPYPPPQNQPPQWPAQPAGQGWPPPPSGQAWPPQGPPGYGPAPQQRSDYGEFPASTAGTAKRSRKRLFALLGVVLAVVVGGIVAAVLVFGHDTLDQQAAEAGVAKVLTESYGLQNVADVNCPSGQRVRKGDAFTCSLTVDGEPRQVTITFTDDSGTYEVGRPT